jgi:hypothetical protein
MLMIRMCGAILPFAHALMMWSLIKHRDFTLLDFIEEA